MKVPNRLPWGNGYPRFRNEVLRIGYLPEGRYSMTFNLVYYYEDDDNAYQETMKEDILDIRNPEPPELVTPEDNDENNNRNSPVYPGRNPKQAVSS